jgi:CRISPR-associated protein Cas2
METKKYIVCYDIADNSKRNSIFKRLKDFGKPVQKSVFECCLTKKQVELMWKRIERYIDPEADIIILYQLDTINDSALKSIGFYVQDDIDDELIIL